ncbi:MAG TPA: GDSL-type esterase/lipase family protein [Ktedonobacterales bacterium]|nr:GDSL-type esterase/lipase family protein [Ktedonobacterales bacterium]
MSRLPSTWIVRGLLIGSLLLVLLAGALVAGLLLTARPQAAARVIPPQDPHITYIGRWDTSNRAVSISYWPGAYLETAFTGTTVKVKLAGSSAIYVSLDHHPDVRLAAPGSSGIVNLTPTPLAAGTHTLRLAVADDTDTLQFKGLILDPGATTAAPALPSKLIEFIGGSVTVGKTDTNGALSDYAWLTAERLGVEHTQIAQANICLVDQVQCGAPTPSGMSQQYFKLKPSYFPDSPDWDFARYQATAVVINLGINDAAYHVSDTRFESTYVSFVQAIQRTYPHALLFAMEPFNGAEAALIQAAVQAVIAAGDHQVSYIDTTGWLQLGSADYSMNPQRPSEDNIHPSDLGQVKIANHLEPILASALDIA